MSIRKSAEYLRTDLILRAIFTWKGLIEKVGRKRAEVMIRSQGSESGGHGECAPWGTELEISTWLICASGRVSSKG